VAAPNARLQASLTVTINSYEYVGHTGKHTDDPEPAMIEARQAKEKLRGLAAASDQSPAVLLQKSIGGVSAPAKMMLPSK